MSIPARTWLRAEGAALGIAALAAAWSAGANPWASLAVLVAPDLSLVAYLAGPRFGAVAYNLAHTYAAPILATAVGHALGLPQATLALGLVWLAHSALDRALGFGLKGASFKETHLGTIG